MRLVLFFTVLVCKGLFAQPINLVPNPSFEIYDTCPSPGFSSGWNSICYAVPWFQPNSPNITCSGSSDYFNACAGAVPSNGIGFQDARTGKAYAGAGIADNPNTNPGGEYLQVPLIEFLKQKKYCVAFYVNTPSIEWSSTNCIQARFTKDSVLTNTFDRIYLTNGINCNYIARDTLNWLLVKGIYIAGGERNL